MKLYPAPALRQVTRMVADANEAFDGGDYLTLAAVPTGDTEREFYWSVVVVGDPSCRDTYGREWVPGDRRPCDAVAIARRLLAAFRDAQ